MKIICPLQGETEEWGGGREGGTVVILPLFNKTHVYDDYEYILICGWLINWSNHNNIPVDVFHYW